MEGDSEMEGYAAVMLVFAMFASIGTFALSWTVPQLEPLRWLALALFMIEILGMEAWARYSKRRNA